MSKNKRKRTRAVQPNPAAPAIKTFGLKSGTILDICIPVFGEFGMLHRAIQSVMQAANRIDGEYRIIVVDNGTPAWVAGTPDDPSREVSPAELSEPIRQLLRPQDRFIRLEQNAGYPGAINEAVSHGTSPLILCSSSDVFLEPDTISVMLREIQSDPLIGVVAPLLMFPKDESPHGPPGGVQSAGMAFDIKGNPIHIFIGWTPDNPRVCKRREMQAVTGACFMTKRQVWTQVGGMAQIYGAGTFEDMEFCFSARSLGYKIVFQPEAKAYHYVGGSIRQGAGKQGFALTTNATIFKGRWATALEWDIYKYL